MTYTLWNNTVSNINTDALRMTSPAHSVGPTSLVGSDTIYEIGELELASMPNGSQWAIADTGLLHLSHLQQVDLLVQLR